MEPGEGPLGLHRAPAGILLLGLLAASAAREKACADEVATLIHEADRLLLAWHGEGTYDSADRKLLIRHTEQALAKMRRAEQIAPDDARVQHRLGVCLSLLKRYPEAEQALARAEKLAPADFLPIVLQDQALCAMRQGKYDRALGLFRRVLALRPWQPDTRYHMGLIYERRGQTDLALRLYTQELNHHNRNSKAWQAYFRLKGLRPNQGRSLRTTFILLGVWVGVLLAAGALYLWRRHRRREVEELAAAFHGKEGTGTTPQPPGA